MRRLGVVLLLALFVGGSAADARHRPTDRIVFDSVRDGNPEIYVMNSDGTGQTRLTMETAFDSGPTLSPDGTQIAFRTTRDGVSDEIGAGNDKGYGGSGRDRLVGGKGRDLLVGGRGRDICRSPGDIKRSC